MMNKIFGSKEMRLLMLGLDAAGKTSMSSIYKGSLSCVRQVESTLAYMRANPYR
jgi:GTPase SAR1 family protein